MLTTDAQRTTMLTFARRYIDHGWSVVRNHHIYKGVCTCPAKEACTRAGKHPRTPDWTGAGATRDIHQVEAWAQRDPYLNLGLTTGQGRLALDIDPRHGGTAWMQTQRPLLVETVLQHTGSGGWHFIYSVPAEYHIKTTSPTAHPLAPGVDTRGDGGQIIVAPSCNGQGPYRWVAGCAPWERTPTSAGPALLALLVAKGILVLRTALPPPPPPYHPMPLPTSLGRPSLNHLLQHYLQQARPGCRNACGFMLALQLRDNGYSRDEARSYILSYQQTVDDPTDRYPADEALASLDSAYSRPPRIPWQPRRHSAG